MPPPHPPRAAAYVADLIRLALGRLAAGEDPGQALATLGAEAYERGQRDARRQPWEDEDTPVVLYDAHDERPSARPTAPPPGLPRGVVRRKG